MVKSFTAFTLLLFISLSAHAAGPKLLSLEPRGAQQGTAFRLTLVGEGLSEESEILTTLPGMLTRLTPPKDPRRRGFELPLIVELDSYAPVDLYPIRIRTPDGLSNLLLFSVGTFPHIDEQELDNDARASAQSVEIPVTINGTLDGADRDWYHFHGKVGQQLVLETEARRAGSAIDSVIRLLDSSGNLISHNNDAPGLHVDSRLEITLQQTSDYYIEIHDARFSEQTENFYRLKIGEFSYAEGIFPLGWKTGDEVEVELSGGNLPQTVKVRPDLTKLGETANFTSIPMPEEIGGLPFRFVVSDKLETLEPKGVSVKTLEPSKVVNGRISNPGEVDRYRLPVNPGENWQFELTSASLGTSQLYALVTLYDLNGKKLASAGANVSKKNPAAVGFTTTNDPSFPFTVPKQVHEVQLTVEDLLGRGGGSYGYRLLAERKEFDFTLHLTTPYVNIPLSGSASVTVMVNRRGYNGPIQLSIPNLPDDLIFNGGHIAARTHVGGTDQSLSFRKATFTLTPKPGTSPQAFNLSVWGHGVTENGQIIQRYALGPGIVTPIKGTNQEAFVAPWMNMTLPAMVVKEQPASLAVLAPSYVRLILGMEYDLEWKFTPRQPSVTPPLKIKQDFSPIRFGFHQQITGQGSAHGKFTAITTERTRPVKFDTVLSGEISVNGRTETITAPAVTFEVVYGFQIDAPSEISINVGASKKLIGKVKREPEFFSPVTIKAINLPLHVSCSTVEVPGDVEEFQLTCGAGPASRPGKYEIEIASSSELATRRAERVPLRMPPIKAQLIIFENISAKQNRN